MYRRWPLAALAAALTLMTAPAAFGASSDPPAAAGWHGREIRDPLPPARPRQPSRGSRAAGRRAAVGRGSGYAQPERLAPRARGAAAVGAPRLPARAGRRPLRRAHPRRRDLVSDQARACRAPAASTPAASRPCARPPKRAARPRPRRLRARRGAARTRVGPSPAAPRCASRPNVLMLLLVVTMRRARGDRLVDADRAARNVPSARRRPRR